MANDLPKKLRDLLDRLEPKLRKEFLDAIERIKGNVPVDELSNLISKGDLEGAIKLIGVDRSSFSSISKSISEAYWAGGGYSLTGLPRAGLGLPGTGSVTLGFDGNAPLAEEWIRLKSSEAITGLVEGQIEVIRATLLEGLQAGKGSRAVAIDLVGRIDPISKLRSGGVIGLTPQQAEWVRSVEKILSDPSKIRDYFVKDKLTGKWKPRYKLTSRVFDRTVLKAIKEGKALDKAKIAKIKAQYENALLKERGRTIARTETLNSMRAGQHRGFQQMIDAGKLKASDIDVRWQSTPDLRTRHSHMTLNGTVVQFGMMFVSETGATMAYPGDIEHGAPAEEIINCRCYADYKIRF